MNVIMHIAGWALTQHAAERMVEMGLTPDDLAAVLRHPEVAYDQPQYGPGSRILQRGAIALAVHVGLHVRCIKSVLPRTTERYERKGKGGDHAAPLV